MSDAAREQIRLLAKLVARDVFKLGDEPALGLNCRRISFKLGEYGNEQDGGGCCEDSLANVLEESLVKHLLQAKD